MPEGPEIRLAADELAGALLGQRLEDVYFGLPRLAPFRDAVLDNRVVSVEPRGKALLTHFDGGLILYSHNQLYGRWYVRPRGKMPRTNRSLRVGLHTRDRSALLYSATDVELLTADTLSEHPFLARIGPDILDPALAWRELSKRLDEPRFRGRSLGGLYLDQAYVAGIGNYLRSEILFLSGMHPSRKPRELSRVERNRLARETLATARRSYETRGVTNPARWVHPLKSRGLRRNAYRFAVFGREGLPCYHCGLRIERIVVGSRRLYLCPGCQS